VRTRDGIFILRDRKEQIVAVALVRDQEPERGDSDEG
jgi:hypothetical protein